jgi:uncharacterized damage-inducible protein DinB
LASSQQLTDDQLRRNFNIGQGSIWQSLLHLYAADYVWLEALLGNDDPLLPGDLPARLPGNQLGENPLTSFAELKRKWMAVKIRWDDYLSTLKAEQLDEVVYKKSTSSGFGKRFGTRRSDVLLHVCTHSHYTTAQIVNMLRQIGVELPDVMLISFARQEHEVTT